MTCGSRPSQSHNKAIRSGAVSHIHVSHLPAFESKTRYRVCSAGRGKSRKSTQDGHDRLSSHHVQSKPADVADRSLAQRDRCIRPEPAATPDTDTDAGLATSCFATSATTATGVTTRPRRP